MERHSLDREFELAERVRVNQQRLTAALQPRYDFIVCGAGASRCGGSRRWSRGGRYLGHLSSCVARAATVEHIMPIGNDQQS